jgi:hydrophobe/amphiphile efflux-3 (HAE3) family protein
MRLSGLLRAVMGAAARRPVVVGLAVGALAIAGAVAALRLEPTAATDTLVGKGSSSYAATERLHQRFGDEPVYVLVREPVTKLALTSDINRVLGLEGCISGNAPKGQVPPGGRAGPCARLAATKPVKVVFGPGTFLNEAVGQIQDQFAAESNAKAAQAQRAAKAARALARSQHKTPAQVRRLGEQAKQLVYAEFTRNVLSLALKYGITSTPQLNDPQFVSKIVFDDTKGPGVPKGRFAYIFPNQNSALIQVRFRPGLSEGARDRAIRLVRDAVAMPDWRLPNGKGTYVVTGAPVVVSDLTRSISDSLIALLIAALAVMAVTLGLVFRARLRLIPLVVALAAAALTFGALSLVGASLTMASIAVLPVLIGLAVDYAIQLQSRVGEETGEVAASGAAVAPGGAAASGGAAAPGAASAFVAAVDRTANRGAPTVAIAAAATAAGFAVLALSPVPMVRGFGLLLVAGIALALGCALTLGVAAMAARPRTAPASVRGAAEILGPTLRGAGQLLFANRAALAVRRRGAATGRGALRVATTHPGRVLAGAVVVAVAGWALETQTRVESDLTKLVPQNGAIRDLQALQRSTDVGGEIDVVVSGASVADPAVVKWMTRYQAQVLKRFGYSDKRGCGKAQLCPAFSLPDLFSGGQSATRKQIDGLLNAVPAYFSQGVITRDRRTATLAFGIRLMPLDRQDDVIRGMRAALHPPPGIDAELAGLPVLAAEANAAVSSPWRRLATLLAGLAAVALVLLVAFRAWRRALVPLLPIALATGWSALVLFAIRIPLNPMSVVLGALVIAIATEFSVLLAERYRGERAAGHPPDEALQRTYRSTGAAVLASGTTAIAGFAVLVVSDIKMLRDFGFVTVVDLTVALLGVMLVLPAVLVLAERGRLRVPVPGVLGRAERASAR